MSDLPSYHNFLTERQLAVSTRKIYIWHLRHFLNWQDKQALNAGVLQKYQANLLTHYKKIASINLHLVIVNDYLRWQKNKFQFDLLTAEKQTIQILNKNQIAKFLDLPLSKTGLVPWRDKILLELLVSTGLKPGQLIKIKRDQLNLGKNRLEFAGQIINLPAITKFYLTKYLNRRIDANPYLLINFNRAKISAGALSVRSVERIVADYGRQLSPRLKLSPQILRHSKAFYLKREGATASAIKENLQFKTRAGADHYWHKL